MNQILIGMIVFLIMQGAQAVDLGLPLELETQSNSGQFQLGVTYSYEPDLVGDKFNLSWSILFGSKITYQELSNIPDQIKWNIYNEKTKTFLDDWSNRPMASKNVIKQGSLYLKDDLAKFTIANQAFVSIIFGTTNGEPLFNLNIGQLCRTNPTYFNNLTDRSKKCEATTIADIESAQKSFCHDSSEELSLFVREGTLTCEFAQKIFLNKGCGKFDCH